LRFLSLIRGLSFLKWLSKFTLTAHLFVADPTTNNEVKNSEYNVKKSFYQEHLKEWFIKHILRGQ